MLIRLALATASCVVLLTACQVDRSPPNAAQTNTAISATQTPSPKPITMGSIERLDSALDRLISPGTKIEVLADGFTWSEGPVWLDQTQQLLFSDVPNNVIHRWDSRDGITRWLEPSGCTDPMPCSGEGSNGLLLDNHGHLVMAQHGDRRMARYEGSLATSEPEPKFTTLVDRFDGKRFNSPNDAVFDRAGNLYFTDPPYGLANGENDVKRELDFQGVYRLTPAGQLILLTDQLSRPNGIALSPDERLLYVANSDPERAIWMAYELDSNGTIGNGWVLFDATKWVANRPGLPDGLKVDRHGNLFATGPGGVLIFAASGELLGTIHTPGAAANCAFGDDGASLFITANQYLLRVALNSDNGA